jgi:hypothetical protein
MIDHAIDMLYTKSIIGSFIRINNRFGKELNSDIFHQSIKNAIDVYEKHPEFDDRTIISDNRVEFVLTAINSNTCYLVNSLISNSSEVVNGVLISNNIIIIYKSINLTN